MLVFLSVVMLFFLSCYILISPAPEFVVPLGPKPTFWMCAMDGSIKQKPISQRNFDENSWEFCYAARQPCHYNVQKQLAKINQHIDQQMDSVIWLIQVIQELFDNFRKNKKNKSYHLNWWSIISVCLNFPYAIIQHIVTSHLKFGCVKTFARRGITKIFLLFTVELPVGCLHQGFFFWSSKCLSFGKNFRRP